MGLSAADISAVKGSMDTINANIKGQIGAVYTKLFSQHKDIQAKFTKFKSVDPAKIADAAGFAEFANEFAADLSKLANSLGNDAAFKDWVGQSVARHIPSRFSDKGTYQKVFDAIAGATGEKAWTALGQQVVASV